jgi:hypothetical protein
MLEQKSALGNAITGHQGLEAAVSAELPIIASARTGLAGKDDAIVNRIPVEYAGKTVQDVITYLTSQEVSEDRLPIAESVKKELRADGSVVVINGKTAKLSDSVADYIAEREHSLPDGSVKKYRELEIEVSAVQRGGYHALYR